MSQLEPDHAGASGHSEDLGFYSKEQWEACEGFEGITFVKILKPSKPKFLL